MSNEQSQSAFLPDARRIALVVGVNKAASSSRPSLKHAIDDAQKMAQVLQDSCGFELFAPPLIGENATSTNIKHTLLAMARQSSANDFLLLYFSGHGQPMTVSGDQPDIYLVTHDFNEQDVEDDEALGFSMRWLQNRLYIPTQAGKVLLILDCCYAGNIGMTASNPYLDDLKARIYKFFGQPMGSDESRKGGLRLALTATGHDQTAGEQDGNGLMTKYLVEALQGKVDEVIELENQGKVSVQRLQRYLQQTMPTTQNPNVAGDYAGKECILAHYPERAAELLCQRQRTPVVNERPHTYIPLQRKASFQARPDEFETLERLLLPFTTDTSSSPRVALVGVLGMGGIGKTQLAAEFAHRYKDRFAAGVFWMPAIGTTLADWQHQFADLAEKTDYLRADDDITNPENETKRARHLCRYLAQHPDALLILDNVENTDLVQTALPTLAGEEAHCTLLYTSRNKTTPPGVKKHIVERLPVEGALTLLLTHRAALLPHALIENTHDAEGQAARDICQYVGYLPLALTLLRDLLQDEYLTLTHLSKQLQQRGAFEITQSDNENEARLFSTFRLSWDKIRDVGAQRLFKLAAYFPEATAIPLWLLGLASDLGETGNTALEPLGRARRQLQNWSMIEVLTDQQIRLHPLLREFGRRLVDEDEQENTLLQEAGQRLVGEFTDINKLEKRALEKGYWQCLEQVQQAYQYTQTLDDDNSGQLEHIERWLSRASSLLTTDGLWPERIPGLFYQLLYNHILESGYQPVLPKHSSSWIRQLERVGAEDDLLLREFRHPDTVTCVAYTPDGNTIATGCEDGILRLWDVASGAKLVEFPGHTDRIMCLTISSNGTTIVTGSDDGTTRIWDIGNGKELYLLRASTQAVHSVAFSLDGTRIVTVSEDGTACIWDIATQEQIAILSDHNIRLRQAIFTGDGERIVSCSEYAVYIWDIANECVVQSVEGKPYAWIPRQENLTPLTPEVKGVLLLNNRPTMISIESVQVKIANIEKQEIITQFSLYSYMSDSSLVAPVVTSDQKKISLSLYKIVEIWDLYDEAAYVTSLTHAVPVTALSFSPSGEHIVTGAEDGKARLWSISHISKTSIEDNLRTLIVAICFSVDGTQVALNYSLNIKILNTSNKTSSFIEIPLRAGLFPNMDQIVFSPNNEFILTYGYAGISIVNTKSAQIQVIEKEIPNVCCFSPNGNMIVNDTSSHNIQIRRVIDGKVIAQLKGHRSEINHLAFSPDGTRLVSGSMDGNARVWNMEDYSTVAILKNHVGGVTCLCVSPDSKFVATGSLDGVIHIWSMQTGKELALLKRQRVAPSSMAFSPDGSLLLVNDRYANTWLWKLDAQGNGELAGTYTTATEVKALHWQDTRHILLGAIDASGYEPQIYHLALEGEW